LKPYRFHNIHKDADEINFIDNTISQSILKNRSN